ncbi:SIS domain-containing protein [Frankia sp. CiP1_Cm_nod2]|uniref:SIS domain-containing protein n=1 Tax=Frankia sp. CiP1_Cm_nod2 TaxID=2897161 RepID=UPI002023D090
MDELAAISGRLDTALVDELAERLGEVRDTGGRLFILGIGGGAGNAGHAVCDLRGLAGFDAYAPTDNPASLTALTNDHGWRYAFSRWLEDSRLGPRDAVLVFSVGGGSEDPPVSVNLVEAVRLATERGAFVCGVVGPDGGETARLADVCIRVPVADLTFRTTHTEIIQSVVWHMLATHPRLNTVTPLWETLRP